MLALTLIATGCEEPEKEKQQKEKLKAVQLEDPFAELAERVAEHRAAPRRPLLFATLGSGGPDPVELRLEQAEADFRRGQAHHEAGHLEHAREDFNRALDRLLTSPIPLRDDPRLLYGFDFLADRIHRLELAALQDALPAEEPPDVPAPIDEIAPLTFPLDPELRQQVERELATLAHDLPIVVNERVLRAVSFFQTPRGRRVLQNGLRRAGRYEDMIYSVLEEEGLPRDLIWKVQAESAFQPHARSRARAVGLWQFMSWRAREYGLKVNWWVDERRDPVKASRAAAKHLKDLYEQFGDWYLVMAAYNAGPGRVERALRRAGGDVDYWALVRRRLLPRETRNHVPVILAVALMAKNPERYGIEVEPEPPLRYEKVTVSKPTDLRRIAEVIGVDVSELRELNPHLIRGVTPPDDPDFQLYVPPGTAQTLLAELPKLPEAERVLWQRHRVRRGETLSHIAMRYGTSAYAIARANGRSVRSYIYPGQVLVIPGSRRAPARAVRTESGTLVYTVRPGDSLSLIAVRHGVSAAALARANNLSLRTVIHPGDRLVIPEGGGARRAGGESVRYRVRRGDSLSVIAARYGTSAYAIARANGISTRTTIYPGQVLVIPGRRAARASSSPSRAEGDKVRYRVRRGDNLSIIAARYGTSPRAIARASGISVRSTIYPGQVLLVPLGERTAARGAGKGKHRVRRGETLWDLSRKYQVSISDLRDANPFLEDRELRAGDDLRIPD